MSDLYKIGQVAQLCDISIKTLRFYEEQGLIKPVEVDIYSGYRFYNDENLIQICKIKFLREVGFSIKEIRDFSQESIDEKLSEIESQIAKLKDNRQMLSFLNKQKGEMSMKIFEDDKEAIGKWVFEGAALSKEDYLAGKKTEQNNPKMNWLYFLPDGRGYWVFVRWTKGMLMHFSGEVYTYEIEGDRLFLTTRFQGEEREVKVFKKADSKVYDLREISIKDEIDLPFVEDKKVLGHWEVVDYIEPKAKRGYQPKVCERELFLKAATFNPNGEVIMENKEHIYKNRWTKGKMINQWASTTSNYSIKKIDGNEYLFMDWKSGDYEYQGQIYGCYVFKHV